MNESQDLANRPERTQRPKKQYDEDYFWDEPIKPYEMYAKALSTQYDVYLNDGIGEPKGYNVLLTTLRNVTEYDVVKMHINCPGGRVDTGIQIITAMRECRATVVTINEGDASSMGAMILMAGDVIAIRRNSMTMFHNASWGTFGKGHEHLSSAVAWKTHMTNMFSDLTRFFLTEEEQERIIDGNDLYLNDGQMIARLPTIGEYDEASSSVRRVPYNEIQEAINEASMTKAADKPTTRRRKKATPAK